MTPADLAAILYLSIVLLLIIGIAWCAEFFLCPGEPRSHAWVDTQKTLNGVNRGLAERVRLRQVRE